MSKKIDAKRARTRTRAKHAVLLKPTPLAQRPSPRRRLSAEERRETIELAATEVFAQRGYDGASIDEIARLSGISAPVLYDHFASKQELHRRLLERHFAELRAVWRAHLPTEEPLERQIAGAFDAWFSYVESHPYAWRMLFRDTTGDPSIRAMHAQVAAESRKALLPLLSREAGLERLGDLGEEGLAMVWEVLRGVLQGLAIWWSEHRHVQRSEVVATAMNAIWVGFERVLEGELWEAERRVL